MARLQKALLCLIVLQPLVVSPAWATDPDLVLVAQAMVVLEIDQVPTPEVVKAKAQEIRRRPSVRLDQQWLMEIDKAEEKLLEYLERVRLQQEMFPDLPEIQRALDSASRYLEATFFHDLWPDYFPARFAVEREQDMRQAMIRIAANPKIAVETLMVDEREVKKRLDVETLMSRVYMLNRYQGEMRKMLGKYYNMRADLKDEAEVYARLLVHGISQQRPDEYGLSLALTELGPLMKPVLLDLVEMLKGQKSTQASTPLIVHSREYGLPEDVQIALTKVSDSSMTPELIFAESNKSVIGLVHKFMLEGLRRGQNPAVRIAVGVWLLENSSRGTEIKKIIEEYLATHTEIDEVLVSFIFLDFIRNSYSQAKWDALKKMLDLNRPMVSSQIAYLAVEVSSIPKILADYLVNYQPAESWGYEDQRNFQFFIDELKQKLPPTEVNFKGMEIYGKNCYIFLDPLHLKATNDNKKR